MTMSDYHIFFWFKKSNHKNISIRCKALEINVFDSYYFLKQLRFVLSVLKKTTTIKKNLPSIYYYEPNSNKK